jgi:hypothetical protein
MYSNIGARHAPALAGLDRPSLNVQVIFQSVICRAGKALEIAIFSGLPCARRGNLVTSFCRCPMAPVRVTFRPNPATTELPPVAIVMRRYGLGKLPIFCDREF